MQHRKVLGQGLLLTCNPSSLWVCGVCGHQKVHRQRYKTCQRCRSDWPPSLLFVGPGEAQAARSRGHRESAHTMQVVRATRRALGIKGSFSKRVPAARTARMAEYYSGNTASVTTRGGWYSQVFLPNGDIFAGVTEEDIVSRMPSEVASRMRNDKSLQVRIPVELHMWLKSYSARKGLTITDVIISYLQRLKQREEKHATGVQQI